MEKQFNRYIQEKVSIIDFSKNTNQLTGQQGHVFDDGQSHTPFAILGQVHDGRQEALGQLLDANHVAHLILD